MSDDFTGNRDAADQDTQEMPATGQSRRDLLKAAVIGSAAAAATAGATTAALALTGHASVLSLNQIDWILPGSPGHVCDICTTDTNCNIKDTFTGSPGQTSGSLYLWLRFLNVLANDPNHHYSLAISPEFGTICTGTMPVSHAASGAITQWVLDPKNYDCHPHSMSEVPGGTPRDTVGAVDFNISATKCLLVLVRLNYCNPTAANVTVTVKGSLMQGSTYIEKCEHPFTIKRW